MVVLVPFDGVEVLDAHVEVALQLHVLAGVGELGGDHLGYVESVAANCKVGVVKCWCLTMFVTTCRYLFSTHLYSR